MEHDKTELYGLPVMFRNRFLCASTIGIPQWNAALNETEEDYCNKLMHRYCSLPVKFKADAMNQLFQRSKL